MQPDTFPTDNSQETLTDDNSYFDDNSYYSDKNVAAREVKAQLYNSFIESIEKNTSHKTLELLENNPALHDMVADRDNCALRLASRKGLHTVVEKLLSFPDVKKCVSSGRQALGLAAQHGHLNIVNMLLQNKKIEEIASFQDNYALIQAAAGGFLDVVKRLLQIPQVRRHITADGNAAFRHAAIAGKLSVVELLLTYPEVSEKAHIFDNSTLKAISEHVAQYDNIIRPDAAQYGDLCTYSEIRRILLTLPNVVTSLIENPRQSRDNPALKRTRADFLSQRQRNEAATVQDQPTQVSGFLSYFSCFSRSSHMPLIDDVAAEADYTSHFKSKPVRT